MSDIKINSFHVSTNNIPAFQGNREHVIGLEQKESFSSDERTFKNITSNQIKKFWEASDEASKEGKIRSLYPQLSVISEKSAGWKASLTGTTGSGFGQLGTNCYVKVPLENDQGVLVIPLQNHSGGSFGKAVVAHGEKGITTLPDILPFGSSQSLCLSKSPDGKTIYMTDWTYPTIKVYDEQLKQTATIDLASLDKDFNKLMKLKNGGNADYVYMRPDDFSSGKGFFAALDTATHDLKWSKKFNASFTDGIFEDKDGNVYLLLEEKEGKEKKHVIHMYSPDGKEKGNIGIEGDPSQIVFHDDGTMIVNLGRNGIKALTPSQKDSGSFSEKWKTKDMNLSNLQISKDGKSLYAVDLCDGFYRSHILVKIDLNTGNVDWVDKHFGEHFIDYRLINDDIYIVSSSEDRQKTNLKILDPSKKILWQDTVNSGEIDEYDEGQRNVVTPKGEFVFGERKGGNLYFLHPKKPGENEESIMLGLFDPEKEAESLKNVLLGDDDENPQAEKQVIDNESNFIIIGGVRVEKKKS